MVPLNRVVPTGASKGVRPGRRRSKPQRGTPVGAPRPVEFLITFPAGLSTLVETSLKDDLKGVTLRYSDDSALLFSARSPANIVARLPYVKNAFQLLLEVPRMPLNGAAKVLTNRLERSGLQALDQLRDFRVMAQIDGQLTPLDRRAKDALERAVTSSTGARVNARGGGDELWLIGRRDLQSILLARRLSKGAKGQPAGSLSTELSHLLIRMSKPQPEDVFLDPFCGSGALCQARAASPARLLLCADLNTKPRLEGLGKRTPVKFLQEDALQLPSVGSGSVSAIVTDPPWGEHEPLDRPADAFYMSMAASFSRVLDPVKGRLVLLITRRMEESATDALNSSGFTSLSHVPLLVNGHPASAITATPSTKRHSGG